MEPWEKFKAICRKYTTIDPDDDLDWFSLSYGFFLALDIEPEVAWGLALEARYQHQYWPDD